MTTTRRSAPKLGPLSLGPADPVRIMAIINVSPESFFGGSVARTGDEVKRAAERAVADGADVIDLGAMSTAPYKKTRVSQAEECDRMAMAVAAARSVSGLPISADTSRAAVAQGALDAGASIINDVTALAGDPAMAGVVAQSGAGLILMANEAQASPRATGSPLDVVRGLLRQALERARKAAIPPGRITLDPGIGFFRNQQLFWYEWDMELLRGLGELRDLGRPLLVSTSRKSFLGELLGRADPHDRLAGSLAAAVWCARHGARIIRTHDVEATRDALRIWRLLDQGDNPDL